MWACAMHLVRWLSGLFGGGAKVLDGCGWVVVGLGNPGERYQHTRHNVGFDVVDELGRRHASGRAPRRMYQADVTTCSLPGGTVAALVRPQTYMNRSGDAVAPILGAARLGPRACVVVVDDIHLPLGKIRVRRDGSDGGHNGLKSLIGVMGAEFARVRVGVGPVPRGIALVDFVLGAFGADDRPEVEKVVGAAADAVECVVAEGLDAAMSRFN